MPSFQADSLFTLAKMVISQAIAARGLGREAGFHKQRSDSSGNHAEIIAAPGDARFRIGSSERDVQEREGTLCSGWDAFDENRVPAHTSFTVVGIDDFQPFLVKERWEEPQSALQEVLFGGARVAEEPLDVRMVVRYASTRPRGFAEEALPGRGCDKGQPPERLGPDRIINDVEQLFVARQVGGAKAEPELDSPGADGQEI